MGLRYGMRGRQHISADGDGMRSATDRSGVPQEIPFPAEFRNYR